MTGEPIPRDVGAAFLRKVFLGMDDNAEVNSVRFKLFTIEDRQDLELYYDSLPNDLRDKTLKIYQFQRQYLNQKKEVKGESNPIKDWITAIIKTWVETAKKQGPVSVDQAPEALAGITTNAIELLTGAAILDYSLGLLPNSEGFVSSNTTRHLLTTLGVGAVLSAVAHDPVKIGVLRPYQDSLEMTFRNRRPDDFALFQAYRTRELCPEKVDDARKLTDEDMDRIEKENDRIYEEEIAKWGYSEWFAVALARSATRTPTFGNLMALARLGILDRGLAMYSLWGQGMDKVTMPALLDGLDQMNIISNYEGFRSMIEPSYVSGDIPESDLVEYWDRIRVPKDLQTWVLPRLRKSREKTLAAKTATTKERDLTVSQIQDAYIQNLIDRGTAYSWLDALTPKYEPFEIDILLNLADTRRKIPGVAKLKRLPLTDYEKAFKNKIRKKEDVLERMQGEYDPRDIKLEAELLDIGKA